MYEQKYIDSIGEDYLRDILLGKIYYLFNIHNNNSKDQQIYFAFQHYLIKCYLNNYQVDECKKFINGYYNDYHKYPHLFCDSPFIDNKTISNIVKPDKKDLIYKFRDSYFEGREIKDIIKKRTKGDYLNVEELNHYYATLIYYLKNGSKKYEQIIKDEVKRIMESNINSLSDMQVKFYSQYVAYFARHSYKYNITVMVGTSTNKGLYGYQNYDYIFINKDANKDLFNLTETICHEVRHSIQYHQSVEQNTKAAFEMSQFRLFCKYLSTADYDSYHKNYTYSTIEQDAEEHGHLDTTIFFDMFDKKILGNIARDNRLNVVRKRPHYRFMLDKNNKAQPFDDFIVNNMDNIILKHPDEINNYPVLRRIYNQDGTRKSFEKIVTGKINEGFDDRGILDNYIVCDIRNGALDNYDLSNKTAEEVNQYMRVIANTYRNAACEFLEYCYDENSKISKNQMVFTVNNLLVTMHKILIYVDNNYLKLDTLFGAGKNENMFDMIYDLRDFDIKKVKNQNIINEPSVRQNIVGVTNLIKKIVRKYNASRMNYELGKVHPYIRNTIINFSDIGQIRFEDWFKKYVEKAMDSHQYVYYNNKRWKISELVSFCANYYMQLNETNSKHR